MSNTEEKTNENDEKLEKVIVEEEGDQLLKNESGQETDPNLQNDNQVADDENELDLENLVKERDELKDKLMRSLAESENVRKRAIKDRQDAEIYAISKMSREILSVYDNLQRALDLAEDILDEKSLPMIEGLELTKKDLLEIFKRNKIEKIEPIAGDKFNPKLHQAMMETPSDDVEKGHIIEVLTVGFLIGERLLRASNVTVSSGQREELGDKKD